MASKSTDLNGSVLIILSFGVKTNSLKAEAFSQKPIFAAFFS
jgi:hypothetical protein